MDSRSDREGRVWLRVGGELDIASVPQLRDQLCELRRQHADVVLDLSALAFLDSAGAELLWKWRDRLAIAAVGQLRDLLAVTGIDSRLALRA
jgi:anti-anti-sigma factor